MLHVTYGLSTRILSLVTAEFQGTAQSLFWAHGRISDLMFICNDYMFPPVKLYFAGSGLSDKKQ